MKSQDIYNDIRPYNPEEVPAAVERMVQNPQFQLAVDYLFNKVESQQIYRDLKKVKSGFEFQKAFMYPSLTKVLKQTSDGLNTQNLDDLRNNGPSVFIANHRDILLDSALLQKVLVDQNMDTSEITFGSNLMVSDFIIDFGKVNRMFKVYREGSLREMLAHSKKLSNYIHYTIRDKKLSAWIAQRKGRTKDGLDKTDTAVLKMLTTFNRKNPIDAYKAINIMPVVISYEWEPCDLQKTRELYLSEKQNFKKEPNEDIDSVIKGIINYKGRINLTIAKPVNAFIAENSSILNRKNIHQKVTEFIDEQVYRNYHLYPSNYLAYDMLNKTDIYKNQYSSDTKEIIGGKLDDLYALVGEETEAIKKKFLRLYANPLLQKIEMDLL